MSDRMIPVLIGLLVLLMLGAVALVISAEIAHQRGPHAGAVTARRFRPAHTTWMLSGKVMVPIHHADEWYLTVTAGGEANEWRVDETTYHAAQAGQWYDADACSFAPPADATAAAP